VSLFVVSCGGSADDSRLFLDCMLLGVLIMQANRWHTFCYKAERWVIRLLVVSVSAAKPTTKLTR
jgi:hypothetical protein